MSPLDALLQESARRWPNRLALAWGSVRWTYRDLNEAVDRLAASLANAPTAGERVGILAPNTPVLVAAMFAAWRVGAVAVPLNARWREYELARVLADAEVAALISVETHQGYSFVELFPRLSAKLPTLRRCCFVDAVGKSQGELAGSAARRSEPLGPEMGLILYTSGTTGAPKGALIKQRMLAEGARALADLLAAGPADVGLFIIPISHAFGLETLLATLAAGCQAVLMDAAFSLHTLVEGVRNHQATMLHGSPALFITLLKAVTRALSPVRTGLVAGSACPPAVLEHLDQAGLRILNLYGMTEFGAATSCRPNDPAEVRYHTVGRPLPGYEVRIVAGQAARLPDAAEASEPLAQRIGEVQVRGPYVTPGYFRQPEQTAAAFDGEWFRTGDLGRLDEQGHLVLSGRAKEVIHVGGLNVFPAEVEGFLLTHPDVLQAAVVSSPHATLGEVPRAFVVIRPGAQVTPADLLRFARQHIANYKLPYGIQLLPELPLLASGKPDRVAVARLLREEEKPCNP